MKKLLGAIFFLVFISFAAVTNAQTVKHAEQDVKHTAKEAGNKTAELASKGAAKVTDKTYKDKVGPHGQTIYIDEHDKFYWIDKKGHRHFVTKSQLKDKANS